MARKKFNKETGKPVHTYVIEVQCSPLMGTPGPNGKYQYDTAWATSLEGKVSVWLGERGMYDKKEAFRTAVMQPASNGRPQFSITCTSDCMQKLKRKFGDDIRRVTLAQRKISPSAYQPAAPATPEPPQP